MIVDDPGNTERKDVLYAFISVDELGNEGILGANITGCRDGCVTPFVCGEITSLKHMRSYAEEVSKRTNKKVKLVEYVRNKELEEF